MWWSEGTVHVEQLFSYIKYPLGQDLVYIQILVTIKNKTRVRTCNTTDARVLLRHTMSSLIFGLHVEHRGDGNTYKAQLRVLTYV